MNPTRYVLDTNIFTAILRKEPKAVEQAEKALATNAEFLLCPVVFYEVYRGLLHRDAKRQLGFYLQFVTDLTWDDLDREDWRAAAQRWADLRRGGYSVGDADLLIGTYAARRNAIVVTDNTKDFIPLGVPVENWRN
jgi:tRNA(fMet)-specific endonuclease VapC